jgi:steroid delta-isomerase-like uncharacterized protein
VVSFGAASCFATRMYPDLKQLTPVDSVWRLFWRRGALYYFFRLQGIDIGPGAAEGPVRGGFEARQPVCRRGVMKRAEVQALLDRHTRAWNEHDIDTLAARHAEDGILVSPMFGTVKGRDQIARTYASVFAIFPDFEIKFDPPIIDGDRMAHPFTVMATQRGEFMGMEGTGKRCTFDGVSLVRLTDAGLAAEERRRYDFTGLLTQIGVLRVKLAK